LRRHHPGTALPRAKRPRTPLARLREQSMLNLQNDRHNIGWPIVKYPTIRDVIKFVCDHEHIPPCLLISRQRNPRYVRPRDIARYLCCQLTGQSLPAIGRRFGNDHTAVLYARNKIESLRKTDIIFHRKLEDYERQLTE
jgi:chromosomal replication initiation ATPase DnaA